MTHFTKRHGEPEASSPAVADFSHSLCTLRDSNPDGYPETALSSSFTATLSIPALRLVLSR